MNEIGRPSAPPAADRPIGIAIVAMGGQGGGVLTDWIVALAESQGWRAQSSSVPGVAQRTGATIYYIEMMAARPGSEPILALMPSPGDVDVVIAAEWMEAGRSMLRGLVTPERTILIASTHRAFAVSEKERPGDGIQRSRRRYRGRGRRRQECLRVRYADHRRRSRQRHFRFLVRRTRRRAGSAVSD